MQLRSWMATLVLAAGSTVLLELPVRAQQPGSDPGQVKAEAADQPQGHRQTTRPRTRRPGTPGARPWSSIS